MATPRKKDRISRPERARGAARRAQPGRYETAWAAAEGRPKQWLRMPAYATLDEVPRDLLTRAATTKLPFVQRFVSEGCPRGMLARYAAQAAEANPELAPIPPYTTLNTWAHSYRAYGLLGLVDSVRSTAGQIKGISAEVETILEIGLIGGKVRGATALRKFIAGALPLQQDVPPVHAVRRAITRFERNAPGLVRLAQEGQAGWVNTYRHSIAGDSFPGGYRYAMDSTVADLWVRIRDLNAPGGWKAIRVVLTVLMDVGSRMLITFNVSLNKIDSGIALAVMRRALTPGLNYPGLPLVYPPQSLVVDAGAENRGVFADGIAALGIELIPSPPNQPQQNAREERLLGTISKEVLSHVVGYSPIQKPFDPWAPAEHDSKRRLRSLHYEPHRLELPVMNLLTVAELETKLLAWAHIYNARPHKSLPANDAELQKLIAAADGYDRIADGEEERCA